MDKIEPDSVREIIESKHLHRPYVATVIATLEALYAHLWEDIPPSKPRTAAFTDMRRAIRSLESLRRNLRLMDELAEREAEYAKSTG